MAAAAILDFQIMLIWLFGWIFTRNRSLDVKSRKDVPFGGLNDVPLNFGGKTQQKTKILGA